MLPETLDTIIVENNKRDLDRLERLLGEFKGKFNITSVTRYKDAVKIMLSKKFHLAILDVYLDDCRDCFDLVETVGVSAFQICAITTGKDHLPPKKAYTIKDPLFFEKIHDKEKVNKFIRDLNTRIQEINSIVYPSEPFTISTMNNTHYPVLLENIQCINADDKCSHFYYFDKKEGRAKQQISNENLTSILERLNGLSDLFVRCHRSWVVNIDQINKITNEVIEGGEGTLYISNEQCPHVPLGGIYKSDIARVLNQRIKPSKRR